MGFENLGSQQFGSAAGLPCPTQLKYEFTSLLETRKYCMEKCDLYVISRQLQHPSALQCLGGRGVTAIEMAVSCRCLIYATHYRPKLLVLEGLHTFCSSAELVIVYALHNAIKFLIKRTSDILTIKICAARYMMHQRQL